ncbi:hypothetical protein WJX75_004484 [Coccomyxa subellipsoidea]|uniref:DOT1 domain-containing protein n=1 Tax=Coccomyxa subellipsoidea TaxID=248742 RepID=A0ABR2YF13_9CHLO
MGKEDASEDIAAKVKALYYTMRSLENKLGGGEGIEGLYGTLACGGMQKVLDCMAANCGLKSTSRLVDVGAGIGRPLLHAVVGQYAASAWGVEIDRVKADKGNAFMRYAAADMKRRNADWTDFEVPSIRCAPIEEIKTLDPATHAYSFWEGVPEDSRRAFGRLFRASKTLQAVAIGQRAMRGRDPEAVMANLGFGELHLVTSFSVSMSGSGRSFTAYVFNRKGFVPPPLATCAAAAEEAAAEASLQPATPHDSRELPLIRRSSSEHTELEEEGQLAATAKIGHRTRSSSGALPPRRPYSGETSDAPSQAPAPRKPRSTAASKPPRGSRPAKHAVQMPPLRLEEGTPLVPGDAEQPMLASGPGHLLDNSATEQLAAATRDLSSTAHAARLNLSAEQMAEVAADNCDGVREAAGNGAMEEHTPRSAKNYASQALRRSPTSGVQKACAQSPRKATAAAAKTGNRAAAKTGRGTVSMPAVGQAFRSRRAPVAALKSKFDVQSGEPAADAPRGLGIRPQSLQPSEA